MARGDGKRLSAFVQDALPTARRARLAGELRELQAFWSRRARERGLISEEDLERYLAE